MAGIDQVEMAAGFLRKGGLIAFPTETVYGLGADARNEAAVAQVFAVKGRPAHNPLIVHVSSVAMARECAAEWGADCEALAEAFWPGPLTLVVKRNESIPSIVCAGGDTVAIRMPDHPTALALIERFGGPIVGPSANRSGQVSPTTAAHVFEQFGGEVIVLAADACERGIESTVVDMTCEKAAVLRRGVIGAEQIAQVVGRAVDDLGDQIAAGQAASPGLQERHYAPSTPARLVDDVTELGGEWVLLAYSRLDAGVRGIAMPTEPDAYARRLYAALREADAMGAKEILIERPPQEGATEGASAIWRAIHDRLARATR